MSIIRDCERMLQISVFKLLFALSLIYFALCRFLLRKNMHDYVGASFYLLASWFGMYKNSDLSFLTFLDVLLYVSMKNA